MTEPLPTVHSLAELAVVLGANLQPGQILCLSSEPGKEQVARAVAEVAYRRGAKFVDLNVFDYYLKRERALHSDPELLDYVPPELVGKDMLPNIRESSQVVNERTTNWTAVPCPTAGWAELVYPDVEPAV